MATETVLNKLTINSVESREVYKKMQEKGLINEDEIYLVSSDDAGEDYLANPEGGSSGQVLTKTADGQEWADAAKALSFTVTLTGAGWDAHAQTVSNSNFAVSGYAYTVCPASGSHEAYAKSMIYADDVAVNGKMTFHCSADPTARLTVNILRVEVEA